MHPFMIFLIVFFPIRHYCRRLGAWTIGSSLLTMASLAGYFQGNIGAAVLFGFLAAWKVDRNMDRSMDFRVD